jgi:UDP-GlcNAc:undecaprenyl-phosphate GlcNAc-1-phosphate transferase
MILLLGVLVLTFCVCVVVTPAVRSLAVRMGLIDRPDKHRKIHERPIALAGGISIFVSLLIVAGLGEIVAGWNIEGWRLGGQWVGLFCGGGIICLVGIADDFGRLRGRHKLMGQIVAAGVVICGGVVVERVQLLNWSMELGLLSVPFTLIFLLGAVNSLNLIDGMDGMLGCVALIVSLTIGGMAVLGNHWSVAIVAMALAGGVLGVLRYNFPPASIFLGDAGSMLIGLFVGTLAIQSSLKTPTTIVLSTPLVLLALPFFDTTAAIIRRKLTGRSIYATDRGHLHHCLLRRGYSTRRVLVIVAFCCLITSAGAFSAQALNNEFIALLTGLAVVSLLIVTRLFGYAEAVLVKQRLMALGASLFKQRESQARELEVRLQGSVNWGALWAILSDFALESNLRQLRLDVNAPALHEAYHARWEMPHQESEVADTWRIEIPVVTRGIGVGRMLIAGAVGSEPVWTRIEAISRTIEQYTATMLVDRVPLPDATFKPAPAEAEELEWETASLKAGTAARSEMVA